MIVTDRRRQYRNKRDALIQALPVGERQAARIDYLKRRARGCRVRAEVALRAARGLVPSNVIRLRA